MMEVEYWPIEELMPYAYNPRRNDDAVNAVAASIRDFGFRNPIIVDDKGVIVSGHTRLKAAASLGLDKVPVIQINDMTPEQVAAFRLADNKVQGYSSWDFSKLMDELTAIDEYDMSDFGFAALKGDTEPKMERKREGTGAARTSNLDDGYEVDIDSFDEEEFECTCPECGFKFNE